MQLVYDSFISNRWKISVEETTPLLNRPFFITYDTVSFQAIFSCDMFLSLIHHLLQIKDFLENYVPLSRSKNSPIKSFQNLIPRSDSRSLFIASLFTTYHYIPQKTLPCLEKVSVKIFKI